MKTSRRKTSLARNGLREASKAISEARRSGGYGPWPSNVGRELGKLPTGYYRYARGKMIAYQPGTSLKGAMTSTRIAAARSQEKHSLIAVARGAAILVREFNSSGKTTFRIEEAV